MAIKTDEDLEKVFNKVIEDVIKSISERAKKLLQEHINTDTYGINKTDMGTPEINSSYLNGTGTPSYEFRDKAWDIQLNKTLFSLFYDGDLMSPPSSNFPLLHGFDGESKSGQHYHYDRRKQLADILNVDGIAPHQDTFSTKTRSPFWDNFEEELKQKLGGWLYTEFNNRGLKIPDLKNAKFG